jgi:hypothetical protein
LPARNDLFFVALTGMMDRSGNGLGGTSTGGSVAALMRRKMSPAEAWLIAPDWKMPSPGSPLASGGQD